MALAKYFSKDVLAISQLTKEGLISTLTEVLRNTVIGIAFDSAALSGEGRKTIDLLVRLLSRLYPEINIFSLDGVNSTIISEFKNLAQRINSEIEFSDEQPDVLLVIGDTTVDDSLSKGPVIYLGSDQWLAKLSLKIPQNSSDSKNPFGAGVAACLGAANAFRHIFSNYLVNRKLDNEVSISVWPGEDAEEAIALDQKILNIDDSYLVGLGAIGNGFLWTFKELKCQIEGKLTLIDPEEVELSNLQRYVMCEEGNIGEFKASVFYDILQALGIESVSINKDWAGFIQDFQNWKLGTVLTAVDTARDRILIQSSLPKYLINSYTTEGVLGVSRHYDFVEKACAACYYIPNEKRKSRSERVAEELQLQVHEPLVRDYLYYDKEVDEQLLRLISEANTIPQEALSQFKGKKMSGFYQEFICGGAKLTLNGGDGTRGEKVEAPLAFQSVLAGILMAAEFVYLKMGSLNNIGTNHLQFFPLAIVQEGVNPYYTDIPKDPTGRCICMDSDFQDIFSSKWK